MATIISGLKVNHQLFKCFNCGRKTVSLGNDYFQPFVNGNYAIEDDDPDERELLNETTEFSDFLDEWQATCSHCGWSDS